MDTLDTKELQRLLKPVNPGVSIYLPMHIAGDQGQQDPLRLRNLVRRAEQQLADRGMRTVDARKLLRMSFDLVENNEFWKQRCHGLAMFVAPGVFYNYRLPYEFEELLFVGSRFYLKPLLPLVNSDDRFLVLALSENQVRLFLATRNQIETVAVSSLPENMASALNYDESDRGSQVHTGARGLPGKQSAVFHGHGGEADTHNTDLTQYCRIVNAALHEELRGWDLPLLLAGVSRLTALYAQISEYSNLLPMRLDGNWDHSSNTELHHCAWKAVQPYLDRPIQEAVMRYRELASTSKALSDLREIVPAAAHGRVETLLVDVNAIQWGAFNDQTGAVELHEGRWREDEELVDLATTQSLQHGANVYGIGRERLPEGSVAAAVLRY